jgi:hypothetical protein
MVIPAPPFESESTYDKIMAKKNRKATQQFFSDLQDRYDWPQNVTWTPENAKVSVGMTMFDFVGIQATKNGDHVEYVGVIARQKNKDDSGYTPHEERYVVHFVQKDNQCYIFALTSHPDELQHSIIRSLAQNQAVHMPETTANYIKATGTLKKDMSVAQVGETGVVDSGDIPYVVQYLQESVLKGYVWPYEDAFELQQNTDKTWTLTINGNVATQLSQKPSDGHAFDHSIIYERGIDVHFPETITVDKKTVDLDEQRTDRDPDLLLKQHYLNVEGLIDDTHGTLTTISGVELRDEGKNNAPKQFPVAPPTAYPIEYMQDPTVLYILETEMNVKLIVYYPGIQQYDWNVAATSLDASGVIPTKNLAPKDALVVMGIIPRRSSRTPYMSIPSSRPFETPETQTPESAGGTNTAVRIGLVLIILYLLTKVKI